MAKKISKAWKFDTKIPYSSSNFNTIFNFFVYETPVEGVSAREISWANRRLTGPKKRTLIENMKKNTPFLRTDWFTAPSKNIEDLCKNNGIFESVDLSKEIVIHSLSKPQDSPTRIDSLFYAIRCAFAHGSYAIHKYNGVRYYMLLNKDKGVVKAMMVLKESTLLSWVSLVDSMSNK